MRVKEESEKADLKLNSQKTKIMAFDLITSWQIEGENVEPVTDFRICFHFFPCLLVMRASQVALVVKNLPANAGDRRDTG